MRRRTQVPLASLPALFAAHQLSEAFVWWHVEGKVPAFTGRVAVVAYSLFAYVALPVLVPVAVLAVEPDPNRRKLLARLTVVGLTVAAVYLDAIVPGPVGVTDVGHRLEYDVAVGMGGLLAAAYIVAGCGALLASSHRPIVMFGAGNVVVVVLLAWLAREGVASLWCLWAAVSSVAIAIHLRGESNAGRRESDDDEPERNDRARTAIASSSRGLGSASEVGRLGGGGAARREMT